MSELSHAKYCDPGRRSTDVDTDARGFSPHGEDRKLLMILAYVRVNCFHPLPEPLEQRVTLLRNLTCAARFLPSSGGPDAEPHAGKLPIESVACIEEEFAGFVREVAAHSRTILDGFPSMTEEWINKVLNTPPAARAGEEREKP